MVYTPLLAQFVSYLLTGDVFVAAVFAGWWTLNKIQAINQQFEKLYGQQIYDADVIDLSDGLILNHEVSKMYQQ